MLLEIDIIRLAILLLIVVAVAGAAAAVGLPLLSPSASDARLKALLRTGAGNAPPRWSLLGSLAGRNPENRRRLVQETLKQIEERERRRRRQASLRVLIARSGRNITVRKFYSLSVLFGLVTGLVLFLFGIPWLVCSGAGAVGMSVIPRRVLNYLGQRRQEAFLEGLADAVDVITRGLRSGLPLSDAMRVIGSEMGPPVGLEFLEIVEGQRLGVPLDQGFERMAERFPLPEVIFLSIVISIQSRTGGNLAEALGNLSRMLRDRKKMKSRIRAMSQEAKTSAMIIGSLPFLVGGGLYVASPGYLAPFFDTQAGNMVLAATLLWMLLGIFIMRKMINFSI